MQLVEDCDTEAIVEYLRLHPEAVRRANSEKYSEWSSEILMALMDAAVNGNINAINAFIEHNVDVDLQNYIGFTPLMRAAESGNIASINALIGFNANVNAQNRAGSTALILASEKGNMDVINRLLEHTSNVDLRTNDGWTALMWAAFYAQLDMIDMLIANNAEINAQDNDGHTALMRAGTYGSFDAVELLIGHNADINLKSNRGKSTAHYFLRGCTSLAELNSRILRMNCNMRSYFLFFLYGCNLCSLESLPESWPRGAVYSPGVAFQGTNDHLNRNNIVRCFEDHYWMRSMLDFIYACDEKSIAGENHDEFNSDDDNEDL